MKLNLNKQIERRTIEFNNNKWCEIYEKFEKLNLRNSREKKNFETEIFCFLNRLSDSLMSRLRRR
jgi:hypothetical protein